MVKFLSIAAAIAAFMLAAQTAQAAVDKCPKVEVNFSCKDGTGGGPSPFPCKGKNEKACCAHWKKRAAKRWCGWGAKGLASFTCDCPKKEEGSNLGLNPRRPGTLRPPTGTLTPVDPPKRTLTPVDPPKRTLTPVDPPRRTLTPVDPPERTLTPVDPPEKTLKAVDCPGIKYKFTCFDGSTSSGRFKCGPKRLKGPCCRRAQSIAFKGCHAKGGNPIRFNCDCVLEKRPGTLRLRRR